MLPAPGRNEMEKDKQQSKKILYCTGRSKEKPLVYVLRGKNGDLLIDTGDRSVTHQVDRWIRKNGFQIKWIFLTHGHFDHTWNAQFFKRKYGAEVILHEKDRDLFCLDEPSRLYSSAEKNNRLTAAANKLLFGTVGPFCKVDYFLTDEDTDFLRRLGFDAEVVMLPGHTAGSMGILCGRVLYSGDAVSAKGGDYFTAMFGEQVDNIYESEKKIFSLNPLVIAPGHGQLIINEKAFPG